MATTTSESDRADELKLTRSQLKKAKRDVAFSAQAANLLYVNDGLPGIARKQKGTKFIYKSNGKVITNKTILKRIDALVIPPAWGSVWICSKDNGHLQATGIDASGRKQYMYHPLWHTIRSQAKYVHLLEFGKALPEIRKAISKDLKEKEMTLQNVLATVVAVLDKTGIRIGNEDYEKKYGSFGLSTLKNKHVQVDGADIHFTFRGKKGVQQDLVLKSAKIARMLKACKALPGKQLFQYVDEDGKRHSITPDLVNGYIQEKSGNQFTAKDFRTWLGSLHALNAFREMGCTPDEKQQKRNVIAALDAVSLKLGNTRTVCRKYYVHPGIISQYECNALGKQLAALDATTLPGSRRLKQEELALLKILAAK